MGLFELRVPFFIPVWRRIIVTAICFGWAAFELIIGNPLWSLLFAAAGGSALWQFFLSGWPDAGPDDGGSS